MPNADLRFIFIMILLSAAAINVPGHSAANASARQTCEKCMQVNPDVAKEIDEIYRNSNPSGPVISTDAVTTPAPELADGPINSTAVPVPSRNSVRKAEYSVIRPFDIGETDIQNLQDLKYTDGGKP